MYEILKLIHVSCAVLSFTGFLIRGILVFQGSLLMRMTLVRVLPHVIDSLLLLSALSMLYLADWSLYNDGWLQTKVFALIVYILLGVIALRVSTQKLMGLLSWLSALIVFLFIVSVALSKNSLGVFVALF